MAGVHNQPGLDQQRQGENLKELKYIRSDEKIEVDIRETIRIKPHQFEFVINSFEEWLKSWD